MEESLNTFGGFWTQQKISIFMKYLKAYLDIMNNYNFKLIYFDGFAGCGTIETDPTNSLESVAIQALNLNHAKDFDIYYLVELDPEKVKHLKNVVKEKFPHKKGISIAESDCNEKLKSMTTFLRQPNNKYYKALAFIDPFGMSLNWSSLEACKDLGIDMWILLPSGIGVNRLLVNDADISDSWLTKLENFLGMKREEIKNHFYKTTTLTTLFGEVETKHTKESNAIKKIAELYCSRLNSIWQHVSDPYPLKNSSGSVMYHFVFASNNKAGLKIANNIIGKM
jgi:three-Cys-motif partner protein